MLFLIISLFISHMVLFDFNETADISKWSIEDDVVMGGRSQGYFHLNDNGHGVFKGEISLENNGGFSSVRYRPATINVDEFNKTVIRLKGDGKRYQFRIRSSKDERWSYIHYFDTSGEWETVEIPFKDMYPTFHGRRLDRPNYPGEQLTEIGFLIGNKKEQSFKLLIDKIELK